MSCNISPVVNHWSMYFIHYIIGNLLRKDIPNPIDVICQPYAIKC